MSRYHAMHTYVQYNGSAGLRMSIEIQLTVLYSGTMRESLCCMLNMSIGCIEGTFLHELIRSIAVHSLHECTADGMRSDMI